METAKRSVVIKGWGEGMNKWTTEDFEDNVCVCVIP